MFGEPAQIFLSEIGKNISFTRYNENTAYTVEIDINTSTSDDFIREIAKLDEEKEVFITLDALDCIKNKLIFVFGAYDFYDKNRERNNLLIQNIIEKFKNFTNFTFDTTTSYLDSYLKSEVLITDFSGTAYTYAFSKEKPVIFYSNNKDYKIINDLKNLYYFKDRNKVGYIVDNFNDLNKKLKIIKKNSNILKVQIKKIRKERIEHFGNSLNITKKQIENLL